MSCSRCGTDCNCACSGDPLPQDWRRQVSMQVRAHKVRKRRRLDSDFPQLDFQDCEALSLEAPAPAVRARGNWWCDESVLKPSNTTAVAALPQPEVAEPQASHEVFAESIPQLPVEERVYEDVSYETVQRPPLAPFPRISAPVPKIIEFPRIASRQFELAEPVVDQMRIFEADEELPPPPITPLAGIEIEPEQALHLNERIEIPIQAAPLAKRSCAAIVDVIAVASALGIFTICAEFFFSPLPLTKPLMAVGGVSAFLTLSIYYVLSLSLCRRTAGMDFSGLHIVTFQEEAPSRARLRWRALATVLSYAALGFGFAWAWIDEDRLCWHDRITHTYLSLKS